VLILAGVMVAGAAFAVALYLSQQRRTAWMRQAAEELRFTFLPKGDADTLFSGFQLFSQGKRKRVLNLMQGVANRLEVRIFDYSYELAGRKGVDAPRQTVITFRSPDLNLPSFSLRPKNVLDKIGTVLGHRDIAFADRQIFTRAYVVRGTNESAVRELFDDRVLSFCEEQPGLSTEGSGFELLVYRANILVPPEQIRAFLEEGFRVLDVFR
jgi:carbonic anhydrase